LQVRPVPKITTKSIGSSTILEKIGVMKRRYVLSTHLEWMFRSGKTQLIDARVHQANAYSLHLVLQVKATKLYRAVGRLMLAIESASLRFVTSESTPRIPSPVFVATSPARHA